MTAAREWLRPLMPDALAAFEQAGDLSLAAYAEILTGDAPRAPALQSGEDLVELAADACGRLYSPALGEALRRELNENFHALTANHHGVDFHPEFFQGDLLFAMSCRHAVPLFNCGAVPGNNVAYPRGILLGLETPGKASFRCRRLPVLPGRHRHALVSVQPPFAASAVRLPSRIPGLPDTLPRAALDRLVQAVYLHPRVLAQVRFRDQASVMNGLLWQEVIDGACPVPPLVSLDMQQLCAALIRADLERPDSLVGRLLLQPPLVAAVWEELNGQRACWTGTRQELQRGSFLFWGVDGEGRALALRPSQDCRSLEAVRDTGWRLPLQAGPLSRALEQERILPSLFLYFTAVSAARGLRCTGGIFQTSYLPRMVHGLADALRRCGEPDMAGRLRESFGPCPACTGLLPLRLPIPEGPLQAAGQGAGAADLWLAGGISPSLWQAMRQTRVRDALAVSLPYHYEDLAGQAMQPSMLARLLEQVPPARSLPFTESCTAEACTSERHHA